MPSSPSMGNCAVKGTTVYHCSSDCTTAVNCNPSRGRSRSSRSSRRRMVGSENHHRPHVTCVVTESIKSPSLNHDTHVVGGGSSTHPYLLLPLAPKRTTPMPTPTPTLGQRCDVVGRLEVLPSTAKGVWRVRLVISYDHLKRILSEKANTEALIERMRAFAGTAACVAATVHVARPTPALQRLHPRDDF